MPKYPRTYHLPFSEGLQNDDRMVEDGWWEHLKGKPLLLSEKLDGENNSISRDGVFARSHACPTATPWTQNMWGYGGTYHQVKNLLSEDEMIYGENLYGIHSIEYDKLLSYYHVFGVRNGNVWYSWDSVKMMAEICNLPTVPELEISCFDTVDELKEHIMFWMSQESRYGSTIEGVVVRNIQEFTSDDFKWNVVKYVRKNHVQTDQFWAKNWKKANLNFK